MNPSPLRYPGGKYKLYPYVAKLIEINDCTTYIEPFCGGAAIPLELLFHNNIKRVILNDYDYSIYWDKDTNILYACQKIKGEASSQEMGNTPIVQKWWDYMADIMEVNPDNCRIRT